MNIGHGGDVFAQGGNINDNCWGGKVVYVHCAGGGTRTPNTQYLKLLPLPIGLHRRLKKGTARR